jgi:6-phosphogluconolactonase
MKKPKIHIFESSDKLVQVLSNSFIEMIHKTNQQEKALHIALSGGSTPRLFFKQLAKIGNKISWHNVQFYWGDERCVPPDHSDSNFGLAKKSLFDKIDISSSNLHRIRGENDPDMETKRYENQIRKCISKSDDTFPVFDWILLGLGEDGHTASIFPGNIPVIQSKEICAVTSHPQSSQKRITLTLPVINLAERITFLVSGANKAKIVADILNNNSSKTTYPAAMVQSQKNPVEWYLDKEAAALI